MPASARQVTTASAEEPLQPGVSVVAANVVNPGCHKPTIWGWFIQPIYSLYSDLGDGLLLDLPH